MRFLKKKRKIHGRSRLPKVSTLKTKIKHFQIYFTVENLPRKCCQSFNTSIVLYFYSSTIFPWISLWGYKRFICRWIFIHAWTEQKRELILRCAEADEQLSTGDLNTSDIWKSLESFLAFLTLKDNSEQRQSVVCWEGSVGVMYWPGSWAGCRYWGSEMNSNSAERYTFLSNRRLISYQLNMNFTKIL